MPPVSVSLGVQTDRPAGAYARLAAAAEDLGFDGASAFHDLGFPPSLPALLEMAGASRQLRLGAAGLSPALLHPVEIAGQVAALDAASRGRAYLGLVRGAWLEAVGAGDGRPLRRLAETIEVVRRLLAGDDGGWEGEIYRLAPGFVLRRPPRRPALDVLVGAWGPRGLALAGRLADEVKLGGCANPDMVRLARRQIDAAAAAAGRDPRSVRLVAGAVTVVGEDRVAARARARREAAMYIDVVAPLDTTLAVPAEVLAPLRSALAAGDHEAAGRAVPDELLGRFCLAGDADDVAGHVARLADAGAGRVELGGPWGVDGDGGLELLGRKVLPALRGGT